MDEFEGVEHLDDRCEKGGKMDNPIPSVMVYFDEKERKAILCLDESRRPPAIVTACEGGEGHDFHTHTWVKRGWLTETAFMTDRPRIKELAAHFVHDVLFCVVKIRDDFDRMRHEREVTIKMNQMLRASVRELLLGLDGTLCHIESEEKRQVIARLIGKHAQHTLTKDEISGEAS
jgi:hypothetical protein